MKTFSSLLFISIAALTAQAKADQLELPLEYLDQPVEVVDIADIEDFEAVTVSEIRNARDLSQDIRFSHRGGNGGNSIGAEFTRIACNASKAWEALCQELDDRVCDELPRFQEQLNPASPTFVKVISSPKVEADDGQEREAVNLVRDDGKPYIVVNERRWRDMNTFSYEKESRRINLALHEYLSLLGLESSDYYTFSRDVFSLLEERDFDIKKIGSDQQLPNVCSVSVATDGSLEDAKVREIKSLLNQSGYEVSSSGNSRYQLKVSENCSGGWFKSCSVYVEMQDAYKYRAQVAFSTHEISRGVNLEKIRNNALNRAFKEIPECR